MSISPVIEYVAPASAVSYTEPYPEIEYVAPAPVVFNASAATVIEHSALQSTPGRGGGKKKEDPMMRCTFFFPVRLFLPFFVPDPRIISNFRNYHDQL